MMDDPFLQHFLAIRIGGRYQICQRLGSGSFAEVYMGRDMLTHDLVAIKLEHCSSDLPFLGYEIGAYEEVDGQPGFARVFWQGYQDEFKAMVFELLGPNLEDLFRYCDGRFSLKTTLMLMDQLLHRAETLHKARYLHRDIKPENFLLGTGKQGNIVYMTDLGLATGWYDAPDPADASCYRMARHNNNPAASPRVCLVGTCRYASINGHVMGEPSRRNDLESLGYMAIYFLRGSLPWQGLRASSPEEKHRLVWERKKAIQVAELCEGLPAEFATYMSHIRAMGDHDRPDYRYLRSLFGRLFRRNGFEHDNVFDWTVREFERLSDESRQRLRARGEEREQKTEREEASNKG